MKKYLILFLSLISIIFFTSCESENNEFIDWTSLSYEAKLEMSPEEQERLLIKSGTLTVATSPDYAPYEFLDIKQSGMKRYQGSDIFLANYVAQTLGLKLNIIESSFDGLVTQLDTRKADIVFAGLTYSEERAESYTFTDTYYNAGDGGQVVVVLEEKFDELNSKEALNSGKYTIGCQPASVQEDLTRTQLPNAKIQNFSKINEGIILLQQGSIHAISLAYNNAETVLASNPNLKILTNFQFDIEEQGTMGLLKKGNELVNYVNEAISILEDGSYASWVENAKAYAASISNADEMSNSNFFQRFWMVLTEYGIQFLQGTGITLLLSAITVVFGTIIALGLTAIRKNKYKGVRLIGHVYVEFVRGIPLLLLLWLLYMISPASWPGYVSVTIALFLNSGAYVAEIIRAGIGSVDKGQYEAARTLGLSKIQAMRKIILPQAIKKILPALGNEFVALIKETSLASVFFIGDLMTVKNNITAITYLSIEPFIIVGIIYFVLTFGTTKLVKKFENVLGA